MRWLATASRNRGVRPRARAAAGGSRARPSRRTARATPGLLPRSSSGRRPAYRPCSDPPGGHDRAARRAGRSLPERPISVELWDGTGLPATNGGGPTFRVRSPKALGYMLRAPGQLGIGRAYVAGELEVDDLDAVLALLGSWSPPQLDRSTRLRLALAAARRRRPHVPTPPTGRGAPARGRRHSPERDARAVRHHYDVSNDFFALFLDESLTYSCALWSRGAATLEEAQRAKLELVVRKARARARDAHARHRLRLGQPRDPRGGGARRAGGGDHALRAAGGAGPAAGRGARPRRPRGDPRDGLPRAGGSAVRRRGEHRHGRARGREPDRPLRPPGGAGSCGRAETPSTTESRACATATRRPVPSQSATSSPMRRRCTCRGC